VADTTGDGVVEIAGSSVTGVTGSGAGVGSEVMFGVRGADGGTNGGNGDGVLSTGTVSCVGVAKSER